MSFSDYFWLGYSMTSNPNKIYQRGWNDALNGNPRHQSKLAFLFDHFKKIQELYDKGYNEGLKERLIRNTNTSTIIKF
jgi:hypothetical protein